MRHRKYRGKFGRRINARRALFKELVRQLFLNGRIKTTVAKAKVIRKFAERLLSIAKEDNFNNRRRLHQFFGKRDIVRHVFENITPAIKDRNGGYTAIYKVGFRRGDAAEMAVIEVIDYWKRLNEEEKETEE